MKQYAAIDDTVYFWFGANDTSGSGGDGASPAADVRLAGAAAGAAPVYSPTPTLLSHANYPAGAYEIAITASVANGFAANSTYAVFCTLAIDSQNPTGFVGSFDLKPVESNPTQLAGVTQSLTDLKDFADAGYDPSAHRTQALIKATDDIDLSATQKTSVNTEVDTALSDINLDHLVKSAVDINLQTTVHDNSIMGYLMTDELVSAYNRSHDSLKLISTVVEGIGMQTSDCEDTNTKVGIIDGIVDSILTDTGTDGVVVATASKTGYALTATGADLILKDSTFALAMSDANWDEILTGATHNIATSAGRRVREIGAFAIHSGTAQAGNNIHVTLAATASATDGIYNRNLLVIVGGTGAGQTRTIVDYDGSTKIALADREWRVSPDATSEYQITPDDTPLTVDHGLVQGATDTTITIRDYASAVDNTYLCNIVAILAGTGRGQARLVSAYNGTTKVITICGDDWVTTPDTDSIYALIPYGASCVGCLSDPALAQINAECDTALTDYDPPTRTEATSDKDELIASLDTIKGTGWIQTSHSLAERPIGGNGGGGGTCSWWDADVELAINFFKSFQLRFDEIMLNFDKISSNIAEIDSDTSVNDSIASSNKSTTSEIASVKNSVKLLSNEIQTLSKELKTTDSLLISMADAPSLEDLLDE